MADIELGNREEIRSASQKIVNECEELVHCADELLKQKDNLEYWKDTTGSKDKAFATIESLKSEVTEMSEVAKSFGKVSSQAVDIYEAADEVVAKEFNRTFKA